MHKESGLYHFSLSFVTGFDAYLVRENETTYEYVLPITYTWMQKIAMDNWQDTIETRRIPKEFVQLKKMNYPGVYEEWMFLYPVGYSTLLRFHDIAQFFETLHAERNESMVVNVEETILKMEKRMPIVHLESLVTFVFEQHKKHPDRLRFLCSAPITKYVKRCQDEKDSL